MVTTQSSDSSASSSTTPEPVGTPSARRLSESLSGGKDDVPADIQPPIEGPPGVVSDLINSIWEPGANATVVIAMNISFFLLIMVLFGLAAMTNWKGEVIFLLVTSTLLWGAMVMFVAQMHKIQSNPENMPIKDPLLDVSDAVPSETKKDK